MKKFLFFITFFYLYISFAVFVLGYTRTPVVFKRVNEVRIITTCSNYTELNNWSWAYKLGCILGD